ncbi:hypothetical protein V5G24_04305 [Xanthobacter sp. VTT E-85241]|uniref:hypothetical protein n=1 Tax=Roseixanthobacter finlandensis TaxID=3119922 RepID=UPI0037285A90
MSELSPGTLVVCVGCFGFWRDAAARLGCAVPYQDLVYTVRDILDHDSAPFVRLEEIVNPVVPGARGECSFDAAAFRPIHRPDISALRAKLATDAPQVLA